MKAARLEWTREDDHVWGPFLYAKDKTFSAIKFLVCSGKGDDDDYGRGASLLMKWGLHTVIVALPRWLVPPERKKVYPGPESWGPEVVARLGRDWYWDYARREFGFSICDGHFCVKFGRQKDVWPGDKSWGFFLPWTQWRFVRMSYYDAAGEHLRTFPHRNSVRPRWLRRAFGKITPPGPSTVWMEERAFEDAMVKLGFVFRDFDGEELVVRTHIEEREWRFGEGLFQWLSWFAKPKVKRWLDLEFSGETGRRKGSWKGGTIGSSIAIDAGEPPEAAFRRYCEANDMAFVGPATDEILAAAFAKRDGHVDEPLPTEASA